MNWFNFGRPRMLYAPEGAGGAAPGDGGTPPSGGAPAPFTPQWGSDPNQMWTVDNKPWFDVVIPEGPARNHMQEKQFKNPVAVAESLYNANVLLRADKRVAVPDFATAKPEDINAYYDKRGRPANAEAYEIKAPDGVTFDENVLKFGKGLAHELGLAPPEAQKMVDKYNEFASQHLTQQAEAARVANDAAISVLEKSWGADLAANKEAGLRVARSLQMPDELFQKIEANIGAAPIVELLARIGKASAEGGGFKGDSGGSGGDPASTPEGAAAEITRLRGDAEFNKKLMDAMHPQHREALQKMEQLYAKAGKLAT